MTEDPTPTERFAELPKPTQQFLSRLQDDDIKLLEEGLVLVRTVLKMGRYTQRLVLFMIAVMSLGVGLHDNFSKIMGWFTPGSK